MATQSLLNRIFSAEGIRSAYTRFVQGRNRPVVGAALQSALGSLFPSLTDFQRRQTANRLGNIFRTAAFQRNAADDEILLIRSIPLVPNFFAPRGEAKRFAYQTLIEVEYVNDAGQTVKLTRSILVHTDARLTNNELADAARKRLEFLVSATKRYPGLEDANGFEVNSTEIQWVIRRS